MIRVKTPREWFDAYVNKDKLLDAIMGAMADAVREGNLIDDTYVGLVYDIIGGNYGQYIPFYALEYFDYEDVDTDNIEQYNLDYVYGELDSFTAELADIINNEVINGTNISVSFGYWDADGTYCLMCHISREDVEQYEELMRSCNVGHEFEGGI